MEFGIIMWRIIGHNFNLQGVWNMKIINKYPKLISLSLFFILVSISTSSVFGGQNFNHFEAVDVYNSPIAIPMSSDPFFTWEDDFDTIEWIEGSMSYDYEVVEGLAQIKNTYEVWTNSDWTKLVPINLTNNAGSSLSDYAFSLIIEHDPDMQDEYDDIRFKHENYPTTWLNYYIESYDSNEAIVWIKIPEIPTGESMLYLFYGNPDAYDESDFYSVFSDWDEEWENDERLTYHNTKEGSWDPDVAYGLNQNDEDIFLVTWEEGRAYYFPLSNFKQEIRGSIYDSYGDCEEFDFTIFTENKDYYRNENPSSAFGDDIFFIAFEHYIDPVNGNKIERDVYGAIIDTYGSVEDTFNICTGSDVAADPCVVFDSINNQFCVVWEDAREGYNNYDIYGKIFDSDGNQIGSEKEICTTSNSQHEPWIAYDSVNEQYLIVWEEGLTADEGPFSIFAGLFDKDLNQIGSTTTIVTGDEDKDYNFPCVCYSKETECFLITFNDCDISDEDWYGSVWGTILDDSGDIIEDTFVIKNGNFVRTDIAVYLSSSFFVSYGDSENIWGNLVSSEGEVFSDDVQMSASTSAIADWASIDSNGDKIFVSWEDLRIYYSPPWDNMPDVYGNIWNLNIPSGSEVEVEFGTEKKLILEAQLTSKPIDPENLVAWIEFGVDFDNTITFDILDYDGNILIEEASNGEDLTGIDPEDFPSIRVQGHLSREDPSYSSTIDSWSVMYVGVDEIPPETTIGEIIGDQGLENWYVGNVKIVLNATDGLYGSGVNHTYFKIDDGLTIEYDPQLGIRLPQDATGDPNTPHGQWDIYYWSIDKAGNLEPEQGPINIKIDKVTPHCTIWDPPDRANVPLGGNFLVQATAIDNGSGIHYVSFDVGPPYNNPVNVYEDDPPGSGNYKWLCDRSFNQKQWRHIIAQVYDYAGHMYEHNIYVFFATPSDYKPGHVYIFGNEFGPLPLLSIFKTSILIEQSFIPIILTDWDAEATRVDVEARRCVLGSEYKFSDNDLSDGCYIEVDVPIGLFTLTAKIYENTNLLEERRIISRMLIILI